MLYRVKANLIEDNLLSFYQYLKDGTIFNLEPDGPEIVESMLRARITAPGVLEWCEHCYCPFPLMHEQDTVYKHFLKGIETKEIKEFSNIDGEPFMDFLNKMTDPKFTA